MRDGKWTDDEFLDRLRLSTDEPANRALEEMRIAEVSSADTARLFKLLTEYDSPLPDDTPEPIRQFLATTRAHRDDIVGSLDIARIQRGTELFRTFAAQACVVMLASSLPSGYSAPCLTEVLVISDQLRRHPYRRLMGVVQMLVDMAQPFEDLNDSRSLVTAQKLRLLHAGVRSVVDKVKPEYRATYGSPVNHEDMLATIMGFSYLVIEGIRRLDVELRLEQVEDFWYGWSQFSRLMGIHPIGEPLSEAFIPQSYEEAATFYGSYVRRHFETDPAKNPQGVMLARRNLELMRGWIPTWMRWCGLGFAPAVAVEHVLGREGMARVGLSAPPSLPGLRWALDRLLRLVVRSERRHPDFFSRLTGLILQGMIDEALGGRITFLIPMSVTDMQSLSDKDGPAVARKSLQDIFSWNCDEEEVS